MGGWLVHSKPYEHKGGTFYAHGSEWVVKDWYDRETGRKFMDVVGNDAQTKAYKNMVRLELAKGNRVPIDENVVICTSKGNGIRLFHSTQVDKFVKENTHDTVQRSKYRK